jgi:hypothetical protein
MMSWERKAVLSWSGCSPSMSYGIGTIVCSEKTLVNGWSSQCIVHKGEGARDGR